MLQKTKLQENVLYKLLKTDNVIFLRIYVASRNSEVLPHICLYVNTAFGTLNRIKNKRCETKNVKIYSLLV